MSDMKQTSELSRYTDVCCFLLSLSISIFRSELMRRREREPLTLSCNPTTTKSNITMKFQSQAVYLCIMRGGENVWNYLTNLSQSEKLLSVLSLVFVYPPDFLSDLHFWPLLPSLHVFCFNKLLPKWHFNARKFKKNIYIWQQNHFTPFGIGSTIMFLFCLILNSTVSPITMHCFYPEGF